MDKPLDDRILKELQEDAEKFYRGEWILDTIVIENNIFLRATNFEMDFNNALNEFRCEPVTEEWSFIHASNKFHEELTKAKTMNVIIDKPALKELDGCRKKRKELESELNELKTATQQLRDTKIELETRIGIHEKMYPDLKRLGTEEESEVKLG